MPHNRPFPPVRRPPDPEPKPPPSRLALSRQRLGRYYTRFHSVLLVGAGILIALAAMLLYDMAKPPPQRLTQRDINAAVGRALALTKPKPAYSSIVYEIIRPSLVRVEASVSRGNAKPEVAVGSGVVIDDAGLILGSLHVVKDASNVRVIFADGTESEAAVILKQPENDLAVLQPRVLPDDLVPATLTDSSSLRVGDEVIAIGNPFGIDNSLSAGVVSGLGRNYRSSKTGETLKNLIQFDAAVNQGSSGGPLLNRDGEVVGIVTALVAPNDQDFFVGIGFAVPMETAAGALGSPPY